MQKGNSNTNLLRGPRRVTALRTVAVSFPSRGALVGDVGHASASSAGLLSIVNVTAAARTPDLSSPPLAHVC